MATFADDDFQLYHVSNLDSRMFFDLSNLPSAFLTVSLPPGTAGDLVWPFSNLGNTWSSQQTYTDYIEATPPILMLLADAAGANQFFAEIKDNTTTFSTTLGVSAGLTASRFVQAPNQSGDITLHGFSADPPTANFMGKVNRTAQVANIATTNLTNTTPAGEYRISYTLADTTADVTAGILTLTFGWTDDVGATTATATQALTALGRTSGTVTLYLASGNITYGVTHTGIFGTSAYALRVRCEYIG